MTMALIGTAFTVLFGVGLALVGLAGILMATGFGSTHRSDYLWSLFLLVVGGMLIYWGIDSAPVTLVLK